MPPPDPWVDSTRILIADTSVVINIIASGHAVEIIEAVPIRFSMAEAVAFEVEAGRGRNPMSAGQLHELIRADRVEVVTMNREAEAFYEELTVGPARSTLDAGEAVTLALALEHGGIPLIDERKARRICRKRYPDLFRACGCTVDIFMRPETRNVLGEANLASSVLNALQNANMRVLPEHEDWVVDLIGPANAAQCTSPSRAARLRGGGS